MSRIYIMWDNHTFTPVTSKHDVLQMCIERKFKDGMLFRKSDDPGLKDPEEVNLYSVGRPERTEDVIRADIDRFFREIDELKYQLRPCPFCAATMKYYESLRTDYVLDARAHAPECPLFGLPIQDDNLEVLCKRWNTRQKPK